MDISLSLGRQAHGPLAKCGNTSGVSKSSSDWLNYTGFLGDVLFAFFKVPPGNKDAVMSNPLTKEESRRVYNCDAYQDQRYTGFFSSWHRIFKIYPRVLHTDLLLWRHFHAPKRDDERNEMNCDWLFDMPVKNGKLSWISDLQLSV